MKDFLSRRESDEILHLLWCFIPKDGRYAEPIIQVGIYAELRNGMNQRERLRSVMVATSNLDNGIPCLVTIA